ncbi:DUF6287 domain-containing protein [Streptococcus dentiloxodontae]
MTHMKKNRKFLILMIGVVSLFSLFLTGCQSSKNKTQTSSTSSKLSSAKSQTSSSQSSSSSTQASTESSSDQASSTGNYEELMAGNYSSLAGTWQNELGDTLVFDANGAISGTTGSYTVTGISPEPQENISNAVGLVTTNQPDYTIGFFYARSGEVFSQTIFAEGSSDVSDANRERILLTNYPISGSNYLSALFYKVA